MVLPKRCAIYTRKSTEEGLDQAFNSLQAQREACESYIKSQKHEGWTLRSQGYDDGGLSGGTMARPSLQRLLEDIKDDQIDIVVVYKVDRLTRSLADFAKIVDLFDRHGVSFVSVTQPFNTITSMGRLTLNVLLSFAQFEREVTSERIRDKIAASKQKGMWMGGTVPLGYDLQDKKLIMNSSEATRIQAIFRTYIQLGSVRLLKQALDEQNITNKIRRNKEDIIIAGKPLSRGCLYRILANPLYVGKIRHKGHVYPGLHPPLIDKVLWEETQGLLEKNRNNNIQEQGIVGRKASRSPLIGKIIDETGRPLTPTHATKQGKRYRYYISLGLKTNHKGQVHNPWRLPAQEIEDRILQAAQDVLKNQGVLVDSVKDKDADRIESLLREANALCARIANSYEHRFYLLSQVVNKVELHKDHMRIHLRVDGHNIMHTMALQMRRRGVEKKLILCAEQPFKNRDWSLIKAIALSRKWFNALATQKGLTITDIAKEDKVDKAYVSRLLGLNFLSPEIIESIIEGIQPADLTLTKLIRTIDLPLCWQDQKHILTF